MRILGRWAAIATAGVAMAASTMVATTTVSAAPARTSTSHRTTYLIHGYTYANCAKRWANLKKAFGPKMYGWKGDVVSIGYYVNKYQEKGKARMGDGNCDVHLSGQANLNTHIGTLGKRLANYIYRHDTRHGETVNLVGHSTGGLVMRAAISGVRKHVSGYPPKLYVANAVTIDSPHRGLHGCDKDNFQCLEMLSHSKFLKNVMHAPQANGGTDWSLLGSSNDHVVSWKSGVDLRHHAQHKYHYLYAQPAPVKKSWLTHSGMRNDYHANKHYRLSYWKTGWKSSKHTAKGWAPLAAVWMSCYYAAKW